MRSVKWRVLAWIPILAYSGLIFLLSSADRNLAGDWAKVGGDKILHFGAFGLWAVLLALPVLRTWPAVSDRLLCLWVSVVASLYGLSDEIHQSYVPGRVASVWDVVADAVGAICGVVGVVFLRRCWRRRNASRRE